MPSCKGCDSTWTGLRMAHCASCHETFSTPGNFDAHRIGVKVPLSCVEPRDVGLEQNSFGTWKMSAEVDLGELHSK